MEEPREFRSANRETGKAWKQECRKGASSVLVDVGNC